MSSVISANRRWVGRISREDEDESEVEAEVEDEEEEKADRGFLRKSVVRLTSEGFSSCKISSSFIGSSIPKPFPSFLSRSLSSSLSLI